MDLSALSPPQVSRVSKALKCISREAGRQDLIGAELTNGGFIDFRGFLGQFPANPAPAWRQI